MRNELLEQKRKKLNELTAARAFNLLHPDVLRASEEFDKHMNLELKTFFPEIIKRVV